MIFLRFAVSFGLIAWLLSGLELEQALVRLESAELHWLLVSHLLTIVTIGGCLWRWRLLLQAHGHFATTRSLCGFYLMGQLANNFMPSNVGGDVVRVALASKMLGPGSWPAVTGSVLVDRVSGLIGLFVTLLVGVAIHVDWIAGLDIIWPILALALGLAAACVLVFTKLSYKILRIMGSIPFMGRPVVLLVKLHDACLAYSSKPRLLAQCIAISCLVNVVVAFQIWSLVWMFPPVDVPWTTQLVVFGLVSLVALVPISINGFGIQESAYVLLLISLGFQQDEALIIALSFRFVALLPGIAGAILFACSGAVRSMYQTEIGAQTPQRG